MGRNKNGSARPFLREWQTRPGLFARHRSTLALWDRAGFASLLTERRAVVSSRGASVRLWGRIDTRGKIGRGYGNLGFLLGSHTKGK
jgi:hypothetical protein